jgi:hypothetical protein
VTLFLCRASGVSPSGRAWSFGVHMSSAASVSQVEADWSSQLNSAWTNGSHGIETLFPTNTVLNLERTAQLAIVTVGAVQKLRQTLLAQDVVSLPGTSVNASLPDQNVILVSFRTATPGKEGRGRIHLPAPDETIVTAGEIGATQSTRVSTAIEALRAGMASAGHTPVIVTEVQTKIGTPVGTFKPITFVETDRIVRTLRGRVKSRAAVYA